ncbi:MAG: CHRD domain-containing protein [Candidatus Competibacterales bacterium]|nr:CHRD domain-containing protein [Candidatus Competibacterales bacterium]
MVPLQAVRSFSFPLSGGQEVPPVNTGASGDCTLLLNATRSELEIFCTHNLTTASPGGHIHIAPRGVNGNIVFHLPNLGASPVDTTWSVDPSSAGSGSNISRPLTPDLVDALLAGNLYVNLHSSANPSGEIRGQIENVAESLPPGVPALGLYGTIALLGLLLGGGYWYRRRA